MNRNRFSSLLCSLVVLFALNSCSIGIRKSLENRPDLTNYDTVRPQITKLNDSLFTFNKNFLIKNKYGQWETYVEGNPVERGLIIGALTDSLMNKQEDIFLSKIDDFIPEEKKRMRILKYVRWYNRKMYKYIPEEFKAEIWGQSRFASDKYNFVANSYTRSLYLHAAHDIGHALLDMNMLDCTSAALWGDETEDGSMIIGRNLDFYVGDEFAENKIIYFVKPDKGIPFASVSWPGFLGVVSGMNKEGLTVTMNAGKSKIPWKAKEPISVVARTILQYASNIDEAIEIASKSEVFVSEALMIGSANDKKAVIIEMSPKNFGVYEVINNRLVCSNHFQSKPYEKDKRNQDAIVNSHSQYRFDRMNELIDDVPKVNPESMVDILRNKEGLKDLEIGYGNEKALNQLIAHHGVVFKPEQGIMWVSSNPYQLGSFTGYNLNEIFDENRTTKYKPLHIDSLTIEEDNFVHSETFKRYEEYRVQDRIIDKMLADESKVFTFDEKIVSDYRALNPNLWIVHYKAGMLYYKSKQYAEAAECFKKALTKEVTTLPDSEQISKMLKKSKRKAR